MRCQAGHKPQGIKQPPRRGGPVQLITQSPASLKQPNRTRNIPRRTPGPLPGLVNLGSVTHLPIEPRTLSRALLDEYNELTATIVIAYIAAACKVIDHLALAPCELGHTYSNFL